jgi:hypothetical protein
MAASVSTSARRLRGLAFLEAHHIDTDGLHIFREVGHARVHGLNLRR